MVGANIQQHQSADYQREYDKANNREWRTTYGVPVDHTFTSGRARPIASGGSCSVVLTKTLDGHEIAGSGWDYLEYLRVEYFPAELGSIFAIESIVLLRDC